MVRTPLRTRLLSGHDTKRLFGSSITTSSEGSPRRMYLAAVAPPHPPPMTPTRRAEVGLTSPLVVAHPDTPPSATTPAVDADALRKCRRVIMRSSQARYRGAPRLRRAAAERRGAWGPFEAPM